jgi:tRNA-splicing ligase RtcB (3'-phosphate/5'-hydroxy nucleic acid ligase)
MLHSGSRNIGKTIGETAIGMARDIAERKERQLRDRDLAWLDEGTVEFDMYVEGLRWAQDYAAHNRALMMHAVLLALREEFGREVATFRRRDQGAVSARRGELGIIPGSMGAKSFIVRGKGNEDATARARHGAGRRLSRYAAKRTYTLADLKRQTAGVECRKDAGVLDEIPSAYKSIDAVMAAQTDLVEIVHTLKQVMCIKG